MYGRGKEIKQKIGKEAAPDTIHHEEHLTLLNPDAIDVCVIDVCGL